MSPRAACRLEAFGFARVYDYVDGISDWKAAGLPVEGAKDQPLRIADATRPDVPTCQPETPLGDIRSRLTDSGWEVCVVVDCDRVVIGRLLQCALGDDDHARAEHVMEPGPSTVRPDSLLQPLVARLDDRDVSHVLVTTPQGVLIGVLLPEEAKRLLSGDTPQEIWQECDCCPGRWTTPT
ncbi:MAG: CBS domain-containing protein [Acidimicrobiia bacterium]